MMDHFPWVICNPSQTTNFRLPHSKSLQTTISYVMKMAESSPNGQKTLREKEKLLVTNNFSFFHSVFKRLILQTRKNQGLSGKGLINLVLASCSPDDHVLQVIDFQQTVNGTEWKKKLKIFLKIVMQVVYENTFKGNNFRKEDTLPIPTTPYFATFFFRNGLWVLHSPVVNGRNDNLDVRAPVSLYPLGFA